MCSCSPRGASENQSVHLGIVISLGPGSGLTNPSSLKDTDSEAPGTTAVVQRVSPLTGLDAFNALVSPMVLSTDETLAFLGAFHAKFKRPPALTRNPLKTMLTAFARSVPRDDMIAYLTLMRQRRVSTTDRAWTCVLNLSSMKPTVRAMYAALGINGSDLDQFCK